VTPKPKVRPRSPERERCWDVADRNIAHYWQALKHLEGHAPDVRGPHTSDPAICRRLVDEWLDYRLAHGSDDRT
jgi:hypothetical protein